MPRRDWRDGVLGNTPLSAARLEALEDDLEAALLQLARDPESLFAGYITRDENGAPVSAVVEWPDGRHRNLRRGSVRPVPRLDQPVHHHPGRFPNGHVHPTDSDP